MESNIQYIHFQYPETPGLISIVICVYNAGKYLKQMLDSIYNQTYKKIEVIVAYDTKSTDNSLNILKYYSEKFGLIIDYGDDNCLGFARSRGARLARGEFFIHFDGDDVVVPNYLEDLHECFVRYPDIKVAYGGCCEVFEKDVQKKYQWLTKRRTTYSEISAVKALSYFRKGGRSNRKIVGTVWEWLVKRQFLQDIGYYSPDITMREDNVYVAQLLVNSTKIGHSSNTGYLWVWHYESASHKQKTLMKHREETYRIYEYLNPVFTSAGYGDFISKQEKLDTLQIPVQFVYIHRNKSYSDFKADLSHEGIISLPICGTFSSKLSSAIFNISKTVYWTIHRIRRLFHTPKKPYQYYKVD